MIGASATCALKASKTLIVKKSIFHLGNIDSVYSESDVSDYIHSLGVQVLSCFELNSQQRRPLGNKAFRVCIVASDKQKLCDSDSWSVGVTLREWIHKPKDTRPGNSGATGGSLGLDAASAAVNPMDDAGTDSDNLVSGRPDNIN